MKNLNFLSAVLSVLLLALGVQSVTAAVGGWDKVAASKPKQMLYFSRSAGFEHSVVKIPAPGQPSYSDKLLTEWGKANHFEVTCSKDGGIFSQPDIAKYDVFVFYITGSLTEPGGDRNPPMTAAGKKAFLDAIRNGKGFVGIHAAADACHYEPDPPDRSERYKAHGDKVDPYIAMLGAEFIKHGAQQAPNVIVTDHQFPGLEDLGDRFTLHEEWYTLKDFLPDLRVLLVMDTKGMTGTDYQRPPYPSTFAHQYGQGRVFYTAMGHREDVWTNSIFQNALLGGLGWAAGNVDADLTPNIEKVTPGYREIQPFVPTQPKEDKKSKRDKKKIIKPNVANERVAREL